MIKSIKVKLYPTKRQEVMFRKSAGCARFAYNWGLSQIKTQYELGNKISPIDARSMLKTEKDTGNFEWLREVSADAWRNAFQDLKLAFVGFYRNLKQGVPFQKAGFPRFKKKVGCKLSFFHENVKLKVNKNQVYLEKIGFVKMKDDGRLPRGNYKLDKIKVSDVHISYDNKQWHLTCGLEVPEKTWELNPGLSIGIDLGIKDLAVTSIADLQFKNINKSKEVKRLEKKHKRMSRQISRKYEMNKIGSKFIKTNNIRKLENLRNKVNRRLANIRDNHLHQATKAIIKQKPSKIVVEDLNIKGMMKNKHLSKAIANQKFFEFTRQLKYKALFYLGIEVTTADRWFPSSKLCSSCGEIKKDLKLKDRTYKCNGCGMVLDRDFNAAINLSNYTQTA